jgi:poly-gamma-glutamate capsule biosynthesis protein CapA/YwtB (metallophosphatase superfamily)
MVSKSGADNGSEMSFLAVGSAMFTRRVSVCADENFLKVVKIIRDADVSFMNMEGLIGDLTAYPLKNYSWSAYFNAEEWLAEEYKWMGFNMVSLANNHTNDWSPEALYTTRKLLDKAGLVHAGAGKNLSEAREPGYLDTAKGRVALIAVDSSYEWGEFGQVLMASEARGIILGRPGVNAIRYYCEYVVDKASFQELKRIYHLLKLRPSFVKKGAEKENELFFSSGEAGIKFKIGDKPGYHTFANTSDVEANLRWIKNAKKQADYVLVTQHTHALGNAETGPFEPVAAQFISEFAHACIDAGADAYLGHGLNGQGIEIYKNKPIFYDLGWFSWMVETLRRYPSDCYENWGLDSKATPSDFVNARPSAGFGGEWYFQGVLSGFKLKDGNLTELKLYPITMSREKPTWQRGVPTMADKLTGKKIIEYYQKLSKPLGTQIDYKDGVGVIRLKK